jgi:hypothetical protein
MREELRPAPPLPLLIIARKDLSRSRFRISSRKTAKAINATI